MSEAWHQHLENLSWWEQIDRFFNPGKYSCTVSYGSAMEIMFTVVFTVAIAASITYVMLWWLRRNSSVTQQQTKEERNNER